MHLYCCSGSNVSVRTAIERFTGKAHQLVTGNVQTMPAIEETNAVGQAHAWRIFYAPRSVFECLEDTGAYGWAMFVLLVLVLLIGYAEMQTGLIDRGVDRQTETSLAALENDQAHLIDRLELRERMEGIRKGGEFSKVLARLGVLVVSPIYFVASFLLIAAVLYAVVALTGRKPEYQTLMSICVYAGFIELVGLAVRLAMVLFYRTVDVGTSLAMLGTPGEGTMLVAIDPFRIWFWVLVMAGLITTRQLSKRVAIASGTLLAVIAAAARVGLSFAAHA